MFTSENNRAIHNYLKFYFEQTSPGYAVLLTGSWGTGKTWFMDQLTSKTDDDTFVRFSIAGCKNTQELDDKYLLACSLKNNKIAKYINPALNSGVANLVGKFKIVAELARPMLKRMAMEMDAKIIIDDLERSTVGTPELVGFINEFVEGNNSPVVLIANDEKLEQKHGSFDELKEKIIGQTFTVHAEVESAVNYFHQQVVMPWLSVEQVTYCVMSVFKHTPHNLRAVRQSLFDYKRLYESVDVFEDFSSENHAWLFLEIVLYRVGLNTRIFEKEEVLNGIHVLNNPTTHAQQINKQESDEAKAIKETHLDSVKKIGEYSNNVFRSADRPHHLLPLVNFEFIRDFFYEGVIDRKDIISRVSAALQLQNKAPEWAPLWNFAFHDDEALFDQTYELIWGRLSSFEVIHPGDFLHIVGVYIELAEHGYGYSRDEAVTMAKKYLEQAAWSVADYSDVTSTFAYGAWKNYQYKSVKTVEFQTIWQLFKDKEERQKEQYRQTRVKGLPAAIRENPDRALDDFYFDQYASTKGDLYDHPVLKNLDVDEFVEAIRAQTPDFQYRVLSKFSSRYTPNAYWMENLIGEVDVLQAVKEQLQVIVDDPKASRLERLRLSVLIEEIFPEPISKMLTLKFETMKKQVAKLKEEEVDDNNTPET